MPLLAAAAPPFFQAHITAALPGRYPPPGAPYAAFGALAKSSLAALLGWLLWLPGFAQTPAPVGDGLRGDYYDGLNFEHFVQTRRDPRLDFNWHERGPLRGVPANYFTVRWTGWLVPPVTGRYVLRLTVDDGVRLWLGNQPLLSEWRGQSLSYYEAPVALQAGHAYRLRLDYCQYSASSRLLLS